MADDRPIFIDAESQGYGQKQEELSFRGIILKHLQKITSLACCEFRGGYKEKTTKDINGTLITEERWIPDTREIYINSIEAIYTMLYSYFDDAMKKSADAYDDAVKELWLLCSTEDVGTIRKFKNFDFKMRYKSEKLELAKKLFRDINAYLNRAHYLEQAPLTEVQE